MEIQEAAKVASHESQASTNSQTAVATTVDLGALLVEDLRPLDEERLRYSH